jgi:hypothetical protein
MDQNHNIDTSLYRTVPRRLMVSAPQIGIAMALTLAAAAQLTWSVADDRGSVTTAANLESPYVPIISPVSNR